MAGIRRKRVTLSPTGSAGSAAANELVHLGRPGVLRFIGIDYGSGVPATTDITVKRDSASGATIFTRTDSTTDLVPTALGTAGMDEGQAASAATDALSGGLPFSSGLYIAAAQADPYVDSTDQIVVDLYYEPVRKKSLSLTTDGSGDATLQWTLGRPAVVRFIQVDYSATAGAGTTMTFKRDSSTGAVIFTKDANETDFGPTAVGAPGLDEAGGALAATDSASGGLVVNTGLYVTIASGGSAKVTGIDLWYDS